MPISVDLAERTVAGVRRVCASAAPDTDLLADVAARVKPVVGWDTAAWLVTDPTTTLFTDAHVDGFAPSTCAPWFHHELNVEDVHLFRDLAGSDRVALISQCADPVATSARHREVMRPLGLAHEARFTADDAAGTWAAVELHREAGASDFGADEVALLARLAPVVADGVRSQALERAARVGGRVTSPGLILISPDGEVRAGTTAGAAWLELLRPRDEQDVHSALLTLSATHRRPQQTTRVRTRTVDGQWVTLHAPPGLDGGDAVVIVEPASPAEVAEVLTRAHGLTAREREVALGVARGESTAALAARLVVSPHTVRDHLKAAFRKTGTTSRTELVSHLFRTAYADRLFGADDQHT